MTNLENCPFCLPGELEGRTINEDEWMVSFLSDPRLTKGHALVVPRRHVEPPSPLAPLEHTAILNEIERLQAIIIGSYALGVTVFQKTRPHVEQGHNGIKLNHLHYHVLPANPGTELYDSGIVWTADRFTPLTSEEANEILPVLQTGEYDD